MAKVVFSNGSKAMAHNLDDLYERWMIRHSEWTSAPTYDTDDSLDIFLPPLPEITSQEQVRAIREQLQDKKAYIQHAIFSLKSIRGLRAAEYENRRAPLSAAMQRLHQQGRALKALKQAAPTKSIVRDIAELKAREADGTITTEEQRALAENRFEMTTRSLNGVEKKAQQATDYDARIEAMDKLIEDQRRQLVFVQDKLIAAYERIIELEAER